jgi:hypothetical protein
LIILDRASCLYLIVRVFLVVIVSFEVAGSRAVRLVWVVLFLLDQKRISAMICEGGDTHPYGLTEDGKRLVVLDCNHERSPAKVSGV